MTWGMSQKSEQFCCLDSMYGKDILRKFFKK
jgi:hypothetical protein